MQTAMLHAVMLTPKGSATIENGPDLSDAHFLVV